MDELLLSKAAIIERCLKRSGQEYHGFVAELTTNYTRQDAILLNLQRACEAAIDAAMHLVRIPRLGLPTESRQAFELIAQAGLIDGTLAASLMAMVGFRNIAVHTYRALDMDIVRGIIEHSLTDLSDFARRLIALGTQQRTST